MSRRKQPEPPLCSVEDCSRNAVVRLELHSGPPGSAAWFCLEDAIASHLANATELHAVIENPASLRSARRRRVHKEWCAFPGGHKGECRPAAEWRSCPFGPEGPHSPPDVFMFGEKPCERCGLRLAQCEEWIRSGKDPRAHMDGAAAPVRGLVLPLGVALGVVAPDPRDAIRPDPAENPCGRVRGGASYCCPWWSFAYPRASEQELVYERCPCRCHKDRASFDSSTQGYLAAVREMQYGDRSAFGVPANTQASSAGAAGAMPTPAPSVTVPEPGKVEPGSGLEAPVSVACAHGHHSACKDSAGAPLHWCSCSCHPNAPIVVPITGRKG